MVQHYNLTEGPSEGLRALFEYAVVPFLAFSTKGEQTGINFFALRLVEMVSALPLLAEFLGTFLLVLSILASGGNAWVIGGTLALVVLLIGSLSGAHVNPAVSLAMFVKGALSTQELVSYAVVQLLGGVASLYAFRAFA